MFTADIVQSPQGIDTMNAITIFPLAVEVQIDHKTEKLLAQLSPDVPWGERQIAAQRLGRLRSTTALPELLAALQTDPFWMVRCSIIQALEMIGDPGAVPALREAARSDGFHVVRDYASKAVERLS